MIPLHLVTGFLGAGKTTFLNRLLRDPALGQTLVVVNEFGAAALDHRLYERMDGEISLLASGCLCCTLRGDFVEGLHALLDRRAARELDFARLIVETSGLADPGPILHALFADGALAAQLRLAGVVTLVDALNGADTLQRHGEARRQVALADRIALTKTDLADPTPVIAALAVLAPLAVVTQAGEIDATAFLAQAPRPPPVVSPRAAHGGAEAHVFRSPTPLPAAGLVRFLDLLAQAAGPRLLRVKGLVATDDLPDRPWLVQGAQHAFAPPIRLAAWPDGPQETALVVIGEGLSAPAQALWDALTGAVAPDTPDLAALTDNPLKPQGGGLLA